MNRTIENETVSLCEYAKRITNTPQLSIILILECVFGLVAVFPNLFALYLLWRSRVFHCNLRLLLGNINLVLAIYPVAVAGKAFRYLFSPVCDLPKPMRWCVMRDWFIMIPMHNSLISLVPLCLERLYATLRYRTYDYAKAPPYIGVCFLILAWSATLYIHFGKFHNVPENQWAPVCEGLFLDSTEVLPVLVQFTALEFLSLVITLSVYACNCFVFKRMAINRAKFDLSSRFLVDQNLKLSAALLPSDLLHVVSYLPSYILLVFTMFNQSFATETVMWLSHSTFVYRMLYALFHPILLITRNPTMRQAAEKTMLGGLFERFVVKRCFSARKIADGNTSGGVRMTTEKLTAVHFSHLQESWDKAYVKQQKENDRKMTVTDEI